MVPSFDLGDNWRLNFRALISDSSSARFYSVLEILSDSFFFSSLS